MTTTPRNLRAVDKLPSESDIEDLHSAVKTAIDAMAWLGPTDEALKTLALQYAELIDNAAPAAKYRKALATLARAVRLTDDEDVPEAFETVREALAEHSVASDLGPKLQAVLRDLGATPATRKALQTHAPPKGGRLAELRANAANPAR